MSALVSIAPAVRQAFKNKQPVVALESTVIAHGLPQPINLKTAFACEDEIRERGAAPATIGIVDGRPVVGLSFELLQAMGTRRDVAKVNLSNLAATIAQQRWGATTVAATMRLAHFAGIQIMATGGIGGVHREAATTGDISADLIALATTPVVVVCAGAKAILDLPRTLEFLETHGVPVIGLGTDELPAFYSRTSGLAVDFTAQTPAEVAEVARAHWKLGATSALLVVTPIPAEFEIPAADIEGMIDEALRQAQHQRLRGTAVTPFLLAELERLSAGATLRANTALLINNAARAAEIATKLRL